MVEFALLLTVVVLAWWLATVAFHFISRTLHRRKAERQPLETRTDTEARQDRYMDHDLVSRPLCGPQTGQPQGGCL